MEKNERRLREEWVNIQVHLKGIAGSAPDHHHHKASIARKQIILFLLMEGLAFLL